MNQTLNEYNEEEAMREMREELDNREIMNGLDKLIYRCYNDSKERGWHDGGVNIPTKLALIHSEISEALEADRKDLYDDKLPKYKGIAVELGDAVIRICDLIGYLLNNTPDSSLNDYDMSEAIIKKLEFNKVRPDHNRSEREKDGGKKY